MEPTTAHLLRPGIPRSVDDLAGAGTGVLGTVYHRDANITVEEAERRSVSEIPIGRMVEPEEIANLVLFLVSEKASDITGQTIAVEGGAGRGLVTEGGISRLSPLGLVLDLVRANLGIPFSYKPASMNAR